MQEEKLKEEKEKKGRKTERSRWCGCFTGKKKVLVELTI